MTLSKPGLGVDREHHAGAADVGAHHALHADREGHLGVIEVLGDPVADRPVGEERGEAVPAGIEQRRFAADVEEGLLLSGEARVRQVFRRGARAHRDVGIGLAGPFAELAIGGRDRDRGFGRPFSAQEGLAERLPHFRKRRLSGGQVLRVRRRSSPSGRSPRGSANRRRRSWRIPAGRERPCRRACAPSRPATHSCRRPG